jgi:hypothetical protein
VALEPKECGFGGFFRSYFRGRRGPLICRNDLERFDGNLAEDDTSEPFLVRVNGVAGV